MASIFTAAPVRRYRVLKAPAHHTTRPAIAVRSDLISETAQDGDVVKLHPSQGKVLVDAGLVQEIP